MQSLKEIGRTTDKIIEPSKQKLFLIFISHVQKTVLSLIIVLIKCEYFHIMGYFSKGKTIVYK